MSRLRGYADIVLAGNISVQDLNALSGEVQMRMVRRTKEGVSMRVDLNDAKRLRHLLRGRGLRMRIIRRGGLPFVRVALRRSPAFFVCLLASLLLLWGVSQTVLEVEVAGISNKPMQAQLLAMMQEMGAKRGALQSAVDKRAIEQAVLSRFPDLTFAALHQRGTKLELFVKQGTPAPQVLDKNEPVDIVATQPGLVSSVTVLTGVAQVQPGDTVRQGQLLVSGFDPALGTMHANGEVWARLWQTGVGQASLHEEKRTRTGQTLAQTTVSLFGWEIPLFKNENTFENYDFERQAGTLLGQLFLPIRWEKKIYYEVHCETLERPIAQVKRQAAQRALGDALNLVPSGASIIDKTLKYSKIRGDTLQATIVLETNAQIGVQVRSR